MQTVVGIVGAGQMGSGIAEACLLAGHRVLLYDIDEAVLDRAVAAVIARVQRAAEKTGAPEETRRQWLQALGKAARLSDFGDCSVVIEAVPERLDIKRTVFRQLEEAVAPTAVLASNTSGLPITAIATACRRRDRVIGTHFFHPAAKMPLVEVIRGMESAEETVERAAAFVRSLGKTPILTKDVPGFVVNRIIAPMLNEAMHVLEAGWATAEDIDRAVKLAMGHPMGPLELADFIGLDTLLAFFEEMYRQTGSDRYRPSYLLRQLVASGYTGRKAGRGIYVYDAVGRER